MIREFLRWNGSIVVAVIVLALLPFVLFSGVFNGLSLLMLALSALAVWLGIREGRFGMPGM